MSKTPQQIAAEKATELYGADTVKTNPGGVEATAGYAIILSAIEEARKSGYNEGYKRGCIDESSELEARAFGWSESRAAHANDGDLFLEASELIEKYIKCSCAFLNGHEPHCAIVKAHEWREKFYSRATHESDHAKIEALNAADRCCNWLQSDDDPIEHDDRMTCAKFIQSSIEEAIKAHDKEHASERQNHT